MFLGLCVTPISDGEPVVETVTDSNKGAAALST